jgi:hypothetical protein
MKIVSLGLEDHGLRTLLNAAIASSRLDGVFTRLRRRRESDYSPDLGTTRRACERSPLARMLPRVVGAGSDGIERDFRGGSSRGYCPGMGTLMLMVRLFHK